MRPLLGGLAMVIAACSAQPVDSDWAELEPMGTARSEHPAVFLDGEVVVLGGLVEAAPGRIGVTASVELYDPETGSWRVGADLPAARHHQMATVVDGRLYVIGGFSESGFDSVSTVWELVDGSWEDRAALPQPVGAGAAVSLDDMIYVVGGTPGGGLFRYDPARDHWEVLTPPAEQREHVAAVAFEGEIWVIGGRWQGQFFLSTEVYDPDRDSWRQGPPLIDARSGFGAAVVDGSIVVAGGEVFGPDEALGTVESLQQGSWVEGEPLPFGLHGNPLVAVGSSLYLPGGSTRPGGVDNPGTMLLLPAP